MCLFPKPASQSFQVKKFFSLYILSFLSIWFIVPPITLICFNLTCKSLVYKLSSKCLAWDMLMLKKVKENHVVVQTRMIIPAKSSNIPWGIHYFFVVVVCLFVFKILWALPGWVTQPHFSVLLLIGTIGYSSSSYGYFSSVVESFCQESQE